MPLDEFWHGDVRLLEVYQQSYETDKSYTAWLIGAKCFEAVSKAIYNGFGRQRESDKPHQYDAWVDPFKRDTEPKITKEEREIEFRNQQASINSWLFSR